MRDERNPTEKEPWSPPVPVPHPDPVPVPVSEHQRDGNSVDGPHAMTLATEADEKRGPAKQEPHHAKQAAELQEGLY
jgi:hypothetical protein